MFTPDEVQQIEEAVRKVLLSMMPTILQPLQTKQISSTQEIMSAVKNHVAHSTDKIMRVVGK